MPKLNRELIREWLRNHNWSIGRLTRECNAVNGIDPVRAGRINVICRVMAVYGDGIPYERLVLGEPQREEVR
ncbi:MAG: hypothetical protein GEV28_20275 [Actinophytocola sp.]|uniref:hypothetical protein n=1 Tax=Actinophytocola sp. TaxID=1872138 RepID=UPI00132A56D0|nr:hypothetical protein [Actinophytocola sp.]MPZ82605.1 hypothetical protein [Actinophytocola sp.]